MSLAAVRPDDAVEWLLASDHAVIRRLALTRIVGRPATDPDVRSLDAAVLQDPWVASLLEGEWQPRTDPPGRGHPYRKWGGAHWRLIALAELGIHGRAPRVASTVAAAFDQTAAWLHAPGRLARADRRIRGRSRICGSQDGAAVWAAARLGLAEDDRVATSVKHLLRWQWPDGGWNCDKRPEASHSSFNESWMALRGLAAYRAATASAAHEIEAAIELAAEFLLRHRVVESERTGEVAHPRLLNLCWPAYWHYGLLPGLLALQEADRLADPRVQPAFDRLRSQRDAAGRWQPTGRWWHGPGSRGSNVEIVNWGRGGESAMLTIQALGVLSGS